jgi:hypothetical protein
MTAPPSRRNRSGFAACSTTDAIEQKVEGKHRSIAWILPFLLRYKGMLGRPREWP